MSKDTDEDDGAPSDRRLGREGLMRKNGGTVRSPYRRGWRRTGRPRRGRLGLSLRWEEQSTGKRGGGNAWSDRRERRRDVTGQTGSLNE